MDKNNALIEGTLKTINKYKSTLKTGKTMEYRILTVESDSRLTTLNMDVMAAEELFNEETNNTMKNLKIGDRIQVQGTLLPLDRYFEDSKFKNKIVINCERISLI